MSFTVPAWVLWVQAAYSLWTFLRNAKFFRIPFILLSMAWNGKKTTWFGRRKYLLLDGTSREASTSWREYDTPEERNSHSFSLENSHDMRFLLKQKDYRFCASLESGKPLKFLHYAKNYQIVTEDIVLVGEWHLLKSVKAESMLHYVLTGGTIKQCEEFCLVDNTSSELLNDNFTRIVAILPLALQAKGYDQISTLVSAILVIMDIFSYYFNFVWQVCKVLAFKYTKLLLARFPATYRKPLHELLGTGSDSFMYCDDSVRKVYYKIIDRFMAVRGCEIPLDGITSELSTDIQGNNPSLRFYIRMNFKTFSVEARHVGNQNCHISIKDDKNLEKRENIPWTKTKQLINYINFCAETGNYPFRRIKKGSAHVVNPVRALLDGDDESVLIVRLQPPVNLFIADSTI